MKSLKKNTQYVIPKGVPAVLLGVDPKKSFVKVVSISNESKKLFNIEDLIDPAQHNIRLSEDMVLLNMYKDKNIKWFIGFQSCWVSKFEVLEEDEEY